MFIGSDIFETVGIDLIYSKQTIQWDDSFASMRTASTTPNKYRHKDADEKEIFSKQSRT